MPFPLEILKQGIKIADTLTAGVQPNIMLERRTGQDGFGKPTYESAVSIHAVVEYKRKQIGMASGQVVLSVATVTIPRDIQPAIKTGDRVMLPDGTIGPVISTPNAPIDPSTSRGLITVIMIGVG